MSKISNVLTMLEYLASGKKYSIQKLSEKLEVSPRMIRTYKNEIEKSGIYIDTIMGPYGGYVLNQSIRLPKRKFIKEDYQLIDKCLNLISNQEDKEKLSLLKDKIRGIYIGSQNEKRKLKLDDENQNKYNIFARAIKERRKVKILYYSYGQGELERVVNTREMFLFNNDWYCAAFCELRNDMRHFDLNRIRKIELLNEKF